LVFVMVDCLVRSKVGWKALHWVVQKAVSMADYSVG
jgi:hypothetical protein